MNKIEIYTCLKNILGSNFENALSINNNYFLSAITWNEQSEKLDHSKRYATTIDLFNLYFKKYFDKMIIVSSLHINYKKLKKDTLEYELSTKGFILPFVEKIFDSNTDIDDDEIFSELNSSFRMFRHRNVKIISDLSFLMMGSEVLPINSGHLFLIIPDQNLVIYPHSDIGFGAFCINLNKKTLLWDKFEKIISSISDDEINYREIFNLIK